MRSKTRFVTIFPKFKWWIVVGWYLGLIPHSVSVRVRTRSGRKDVQKLKCKKRHSIKARDVAFASPVDAKFYVMVREH